MVKTAVEAATAAADDGVDIEVIDLRTLSPLDPRRCTSPFARQVAPSLYTRLPSRSDCAEIAARVAEVCFYSLEAPVLRVGGFDTPYPPSRIEEEYLPDLDRVLDAVDRSLAF